MQHRRPANLLEIIRPFHLLTAVVVYGLGAGIARYLGWDVESGVFWLGLVWVLGLLTGSYFLGESLKIPLLIGLIGHFRILRENQGDLAPGLDSQERREQRDLLTGSALLLVTAALTTWMGWLGWLAPASVVVLGLMGIGALLEVLPPVQEPLWSLKEVVFSLLHAVLPAVLAFVLQTGEVHRLVALSTFPLFGLHLGLMLILQLVSFQEDLKTRVPTLLTGIGWVGGIALHNYLVIASFFLLALAMFFDFPASIILPAMTGVLPAAYLVWYLNDLKRGAPTRWGLITALSLAGFFLPLYFLMFSFWFD